MNLFGEKIVCDKFYISKAQVYHFSSWCELLVQPSVVAIGLKLTTCEP